MEFLSVAPQLRVDDYTASLALAAELGARRLSVSGDDTDFGRLADNFGTLCDLAAGSVQ